MVNVRVSEKQNDPHFVQSMLTHNMCICITVVSLILFSGTSLIWSPTGLGKNDLNREVTILQGTNLVFFAPRNTIWN